LRISEDKSDSLDDHHHYDTNKSGDDFGQQYNQKPSQKHSSIRNSRKAKKVTLKKTKLKEIEKGRQEKSSTFKKPKKNS